MKEKFNVTGMTCSACSAHVEKAVEKVAGVSGVNVSLLTNSMTVSYDEKVTNADNIIKAVEKSGYGAYLQKSETVSNKKSKQSENGVSLFRLVLSLVFCAVLMYVSMGHMFGAPLPKFVGGASNSVSFALIQFLLCLPVWYVNRSYFTVGFKRLFGRSPNMDSLIAVGSTASAIYGVVLMFVMSAAVGSGDFALAESYTHQLYFESSAMILALVDLGKYFEGRSKVKTGGALEKLRKLAPDKATLWNDGEETETDGKMLKVGDIVVIKAGASFPADGKVIFGNCFADESAISGESIPCEKQIGDTVIGGTVCVGGYARVEVNSVGGDSVLEKIIAVVEDASASKAPIQRLADKIAGVFVPVVMAVSLVTFIVWLCIKGEVSTALDFAVSVLVISCPCALGLATPVAVMVATGKGAENGILIKNGEILEKLCSIKQVVLDKTGTLTLGKPQIKRYQTIIDDKEFFAVVGGIEKQSEHPLGKAAVSFVSDRGIAVTAPQSFATVAGKGVTATVNGDLYAVGNASLMRDCGVNDEDYAQIAEEYSRNALTCLIVCKNGKYVGIIGVGDEIKETSKEAITLLKQMNVKTVLLTGDNAVSAKAVCDEVGIDEFYAEVQPTQKAEIVALLQKDGVCAMVGDGINDAPALARADIGFAVANGTDIAVDSADVVLVKNDIRDVASAIQLSKKTTRNIKQNLFWAFFYNSLGIPLAAGVLYFAPIFVKLNPMIAAAAMSLSSLFVVTNALRLRFFKPMRIEKKCCGTKCNIEENNDNIEQNKGEEKMKYQLSIEGMMCQHCVNRVDKALRSVEGVSDVTVNLEEKTAVVTADKTNLADALKAAVEAQDYVVKEIK